MTNDEIRMTNECPKRPKARVAPYAVSLAVSFVIRHSCFVIAVFIALRLGAAN